MAQPGLSVKNIERINIIVPPIKEQEKVSKQILTLEQKIEQAQHIIKEAKAKKEAVLKEYLE